jgi:hypothetical protein
MKQPRFLPPMTGTPREPGAVTGRLRPATRGGYPMSIDVAAERDHGAATECCSRIWRAVLGCGVVGAGGGRMRGPGAGTVT